MNSEICPICIDIIEEDIYVTDCKHSFHLECLFEWTKNNTTCPCCRCVLKNKPLWIPLLFWYKPKRHSCITCNIER